MPYFFNTDDERAAMLAAIGAGSIEELFSMAPAEFRLKRPLALPPALTEMELTAELGKASEEMVAAGRSSCFLGGGSYDHFVPAVVDALASRGEFYTSYTPYQAEASQGNLQVFFEYQTLIARLTGMDVSNASLYDGASAATEAVLMCMAATGRHGAGQSPAKVVVSASVHPEYRQVLATYLANLSAQVVTVGADTGQVSLSELESAVDSNTACVLIQHPNFFGCLEPVERISEIAKKAGAMFVAAVDPISLGILKRPGDYGADVVVAEGQSLGSPMAYGGPYLGIMACREEFTRRMPGRIAGQTVDRRGERCWVLTLQTREQHIRREKATSNICTNQGLYALRATIYLSLMGPAGMREVAELCLRKSHYAQSRLTATGGLRAEFSAPFFKEFVVRDPRGRLSSRLGELAAQGLLAGVPLGNWYPRLEDCLLVAVTEKRTRAEIDELARRLLD